MTNRFKLTVSEAAVALALAALAGTAQAQAQSAPPPGYLGATGDPVVTSPYGLCWKTSDWTPDKAVIPCDAVRVVQAPPPPVAVAPPAPPAPAPTPLVVAPPPQPPIIEQISLSADVLFEFDRAELRPAGREKLDEISERLKGANVQQILAIGHADRIGNEKYNQELSQARAEAVRDYLTKRGVEQTKVRSEGRGETQPVTGGQCKGVTGTKLISCLQPDRRVDIEVRGERQVAGSQAPAGAGATTPGGSSGGTRGN